MSKILENIDKQIIESATETLQKEGIAGFSVRNIAKKCNISPGTMYNYYSSKRELMNHIIKVYIEKILADLEEQFTQNMSREEKCKILFEKVKKESNTIDNEVVKTAFEILFETDDENTEKIKDTLNQYKGLMKNYMKKELDISDDVLADILVKNIVLFAHDWDSSFEELWKRLSKMI